MADHGKRAGVTDFRLWQARAVLAWERLWPVLWPAASIAAAFLALALFNVLPLLPGWLHAGVLGVAAVGFAAALVRAFRGFHVPGAGEALRRIERDSGLPHRPLQTLRDAVAAGADSTAAALWRLHQERARAAVARVSIRLPRANVAARDPWALRALTGILLFVAAAGSWGDWRPRLLAALSPAFDGAGGGSLAALDLWIAPPEHTGLPPIFLRSASSPEPAAAIAEVRAPQGSVVMARVTGGSGAPELEVNGATKPFETVDRDSFQIQASVETGPRIAVTQGLRELGAWPVTVIPDAAPAIAFPAPPSKGERGALRIEYVAEDDYGLERVTARVRRAPGAEAAAGGTPGPAEESPTEESVDLPLGLGGVRPKEARGAGFHDLTAHPWAGLPVTVTLLATDGAGQTGRSEEFPMVLPERTFNHPVARAIVEERRKLTVDPLGAREGVAHALADISSRPMHYGDDLVVFLALRTAASRLMLDQSAASVPALQSLLWETALRVEDGGLSLAERDLREAQQRLAEALERGADDAEVQRLMDELQAALDRFLDAMEDQIREAMERGDQMPTLPPEMAERMMDRADLQDMLDRMREMTETGARDAAREMLSQLQQMLESMRSGAMAGMQQPQQGAGEAWEMMRELQELTQQQQQLLDETFREAQGEMDVESPAPTPNQNPRGRGQQGNPRAGSPLMQQQAERQEALRRQLGEVMRRMGEMTGDIPRPLGRAERAMRDAGEALEQGSPGNAVPPQTQAMDELQQGLQAYAEQMMQQMQQMMGMSPGMMQGQQNQPGRGRDPLGRRPPGQGALDGDDVRIPEEADLQRAREILDELRRRAGQFSRPKVEREYIDRLLRQF